MIGKHLWKISEKSKIVSGKHWLIWHGMTH